MMIMMMRSCDDADNDDVDDADNNDVNGGRGEDGRQGPAKAFHPFVSPCVQFYC